MEYPIGERSFTGIEHPYIIHDIAQAVQSLGGSRQLGQAIAASSEDECVATLYNRPRDPLSVPISSHLHETHDFLLAIKVPRLLRRRRKRARASATQSISDGGAGNATVADEGMEDEKMSSAERLLRSLKDHPTKCTTEVLGTIERTHRFRDMPDFGFATSTGSFVKRFQDLVLSGDYEQLSRYSFDLTNSKPSGTEILPPPRLSPFEIPFNYSYRQNPAVRKVVSQDGKINAVNESSTRKILTPRLAFDAPEVPSHPPEGITPESQLDDASQALITALRALFEQRPLWTRRALLNNINYEESRSLLRYSYQYVAYMFRSGPWRESFVKLGLDPRKHPALRMYQTMTFQLDNELQTTSRSRPPRTGRGGARQHGAHQKTIFGMDELGRRSHIFDGSQVALDGKTWQVCDIIDPHVAAILDTAEIRNSCETRIDGFFCNGTWARARVVTRVKIQAILRGEDDIDIADVERIVQMPDHVDDSNKHLTLAGRYDTPWFTEMAEAIRALLRAPDHNSTTIYNAPDLPVMVPGVGNDARVHNAMSALSAPGVTGRLAATTDGRARAGDGDSDDAEEDYDEEDDEDEGEDEDEDDDGANEEEEDDDGDDGSEDDE